jgi:hypothetical protein
MILSEHGGLPAPDGRQQPPVRRDDRMIPSRFIENATMPAHRDGLRSAVVIGLAVVCASLLFGASMLWIHYGTAVFFEMITSGIAACV